MNTGNENLVEIMSRLGAPPEGVSIETFAIAKVDPAILSRAARTETPSYEQLKELADNNPAFFQKITEVPQPEWKLGEGVLLKQQRLSRPRRIAATVLASFTLATGMGALTYEAKKEVRKDFPELRDKKPITESALIGGAVGIGGAIPAYLFSSFFSHRLARRPARKIVKQAEQNSV